jgi:hypothetical protein
MSGWQVVVAPVLALAATRALMRAWAGGRIKERKPLVALCGFGLAALAWAAVVIGWRAWEIPNAGPPLNRAAFKDSLPGIKDNRAGQKLQEALANINDPNKKGEKDWLPLVAEAARAPVGMIEALRGDSEVLLQPNLSAARNIADHLQGSAQGALAQGQPEVAVERLAQILALTRTMRNKVTLLSYITGVKIEDKALQELDGWLAQGKLRPELFQPLLDELNRHAAETPSALDCLQTECFRARGLLDTPTAWAFRTHTVVPRKVPEKWVADGIVLSLATPWENERKMRLWRAVWAGLFRALRTPHWQRPEVPWDPQAMPHSAGRILDHWLPAAEGPDSSLTRARLEQLLTDSWLTDERLFAPVRGLISWGTYARWRVDASRLAVALGLYQFRERKAAQRLEDLVPKYLPKLPEDPYSGQPFRYRISEGEEIETHGPNGLGKLTVQRGQGVVWSTGPDRVDNGGRKHEVADDNPPAREGLDLVTLTPRWP